MLTMPHLQDIAAHACMQHIALPEHQNSGCQQSGSISALTAPPGIAARTLHTVAAYCPLPEHSGGSCG
jgi:hypothetical protein